MTKKPKAAEDYTPSDIDIRNALYGMIPNNGLITEGDVRKFLEDKFGEGNVPEDKVKDILNSLE